MRTLLRECHGHCRSVRVKSGRCPTSVRIQAKLRSQSTRIAGVVHPGDECAPARNNLEYLRRTSYAIWDRAKRHDNTQTVMTRHGAPGGPRTAHTQRDGVAYGLTWRALRLS